MLFVLAYLFINLTTINLLNTRHYSVTRGQLAYRVYAYFATNYPAYPAGQSFRFVNDSPVTIQQWGVSKQISQALSGSEFFKVFYRNTDIKVYFDDLDTDIPENAIPIGSSQFIK